MTKEKIKTFKQMYEAMQECIDSMDTESAHNEADSLLCEIALNTRFTLRERIELIDLYQKVEKWYA